MKRYNAEIDRNRLENTLKLTFNRVPVEKVVEMYKDWSVYASKRKGKLKVVNWRGMPNNPIEVSKDYVFKCLEMRINSKRYSHDEKLQTVELSFSGNRKLDGVVHDVMTHFFKKYLKPKKHEPFLRNIWLEKLV